MRTCTVCKEEKDDSEFVKNKSAKGGITNVCKLCHRVATKKYNDEHKELIAERQKKYREENKEKTRLKSKLFREAHRDEIIQKKKEYYEKNKESILKHNKDYKKNNEEHVKRLEKNRYKINREKFLQKSKEYREKNKSKINIRRKLVRDNNKEKIRIQKQISYYKNIKTAKEYHMKNRDRILKRQKEYAKTQWGKVVFKTINQRRRTRVKNLESTLTPYQWNEILKYQKNRCAICGKPFSSKLKPTIDHIIPLSKGGGLFHGNVQALCQPCNTKKKDAIIKSYITTWGIYNYGVTT